MAACSSRVEWAYSSSYKKNFENARCVETGKINTIIIKRTHLAKKSSMLMNVTQKKLSQLQPTEFGAKAIGRI